MGFEHYVKQISKFSRELLPPGGKRNLFSSTMQFPMWHSVFYSQNVSSSSNDGEEEKEIPSDKTNVLFVSARDVVVSK